MCALFYNPFRQGQARSGQVLTLFWMSLSIVGPPWLLPTTTSGLNFCIAAAWVRTCVEWIRQILAAAWIRQSFTLTTVAKSLVCLTYSWWFELRCRVQEVKSYSAKREMQARPSLRTMWKASGTVPNFSFKYLGKGHEWRSMLSLDPPPWMNNTRTPLWDGSTAAAADAITRTPQTGCRSYPAIGVTTENKTASEALQLLLFRGLIH